MDTSERDVVGVGGEQESSRGMARAAERDKRDEPAGGQLQAPPVLDRVVVPDQRSYLEAGEAPPRHLATPPHLAYLKISEGCRKVHVHRMSSATA